MTNRDHSPSISQNDGGDAKLRTEGSGLDLDALEAVARAATPGPWCWEQCGDKCDAPVVGIAWRDDDVDCKHPMTGLLQPYDGAGAEVTYYRETIAYEIQDCDGCSASRNAQHIATFDPPTVLRLIQTQRELVAALKAVIAVADRKTDVFDAAHAAIAKAEVRS